MFIYCTGREAILSCVYVTCCRICVLWVGLCVFLCQAQHNIIILRSMFILVYIQYILVYILYILPYMKCTGLMCMGSC